MTPDEIPDLITFLIGNGYQIETQITNMLNQSELKLSNRKLGFTVTYYGGNQPNITYMR
jgi:transketolase N-terminal domain/subunit